VRVGDEIHGVEPDRRDLYNSLPTYDSIISFTYARKG
jgi:hypothetical protein